MREHQSMLCCMLLFSSVPSPFFHSSPCVRTGIIFLIAGTSIQVRHSGIMPSRLDNQSEGNKRGWEETGRGTDFYIQGPANAFLEPERLEFSKP